jgi:ubiquinone/menaquinone biosynthesis C-methylase UbiE
MRSPWYLPRVPEPEEMDSSDEVEVYNSAAAEAHLERIDESFVQHVVHLLPRAEHLSGRALDIGCGPAQIPIKLLQRLHGARMVVLDGSPNMIRVAKENARRAGVADRMRFVLGDGKSLPFANSSFSMITCNSMLHHVREPLSLLKEMRRVAASDATILLRDLRRPMFPLLWPHMWWHGRKYRGLMRQLFRASVRASYTADELGRMLRDAPIPRARVFRYKRAHIGIERPGGI